MSDLPQPTPTPAHGALPPTQASATTTPAYVQTTPGAPPHGYAPSFPPPAAPTDSRMLGLVALALGIAAVVVATAVSGIAGTMAAAGAMQHAIGISPEGLENMSGDQLLTLLTPVRGLALVTEIGYWFGTVLGLASLVLGIVAIATRRGRGQGIAAVIVAAVGPVVYAIVVGALLVAGIGAGAS